MMYREYDEFIALTAIFDDINKSLDFAPLSTFWVKKVVFFNQLAYNKGTKEVFVWHWQHLA